MAYLLWPSSIVVVGTDVNGCVGVCNKRGMVFGPEGRTARRSESGREQTLPESTIHADKVHRARRAVHALVAALLLVPQR